MANFGKFVVPFLLSVARNRSLTCLVFASLLAPVLVNDYLQNREDNPIKPVCHTTSNSITNLGSVMADRFDALKPVALSPAAAAKLEKLGIDADKMRRRQIPRDWAFSYEKLAADGDFGPRDGHFHVLSARRCTLTGPLVNPESRKSFMRWTLSMPNDSREGRSKIELGIATSGLYTNSTRILQTVKLKPGERKTVTVAADFAGGLPSFRPLAKTTGDVTFEEVAILEAPDDLAAAGLTLVEGTLGACSEIPDPGKSDYPDCRFVCHFTGNSIVKGAPCPQNLSLVVEAFASHKPLGASRLKPGDKVRCLVLPFEKLPEDKKSTQQADDLNLFTLPSYYAVDIRQVRGFVDDDLRLAVPASGIYFTDVKKEYVSIFDRHINPPLTEEERRLQAEAIRDDLAQIKGLLAKYTPEKREALRLAFDQAWETEKKKDAPGYNRVATANYGTCVWRNVDNSFWALPENYRLRVEESKLSADKIEALVALRDFLEANGCQLIVSLVPHFYEIAARVINRDFRQVPDFQTGDVVKQLLENGIETVYGAEAIIANYNRYPWAYFYPANAHPSDTAQDVLTDLVAGKLWRYHFAAGLDKTLFTIRAAPHCYGNNKEYVFPRNCDIGKNVTGEAYLCREVLYDGKEAATLFFSMPPGPVFVSGNSYVGLPRRQSFATLLSAKTGLVINTVARANYGPLTVTIQDFFASPDKHLFKKKVMVMQVGTDHLLADYQFNNIRQMDAMANLLSGKIQVGTLPTAKPDEVAETPDNALALKMYNQLTMAKLFLLPQDGKKLILQTSMAKFDSAKETVIVIPAVKTAEQSVSLSFNDKPVEILTGIK